MTQGRHVAARALRRNTAVAAALENTITVRLARVSAAPAHVPSEAYAKVGAPRGRAKATWAVGVHVAAGRDARIEVNRVAGELPRAPANRARRAVAIAKTLVPA